MFKKSKRLPTKPENAISVVSVKDEGKIIRELKCEHCSYIGMLFTKGQSLSFYKGMPLDIIHVECGKCGREYNIYFDINNIETDMPSIARPL